jgi:hypothetical protein
MRVRDVVVGGSGIGPHGHDLEAERIDGSRQPVPVKADLKRTEMDLLERDRLGGGTDAAGSPVDVHAAKIGIDLLQLLQQSAERGNFHRSFVPVPESLGTVLLHALQLGQHLLAQRRHCSTELQAVSFVQALPRVL